MKKLLGKAMCLAGFAGLVLLNGAAVQAEVGYCSGGIVMEAAGKATGNAVRVQSTRNDCTASFSSGTSLWFNLEASGQDAMLATALTALSLGNPVTIVSKTGNSYENWGTLVHIGVAK